MYGNHGLRQLVESRMVSYRIEVVDTG